MVVDGLEFIGRIGLAIAALAVLLAAVDWLVTTRLYQALCNWLDRCMRSSGLD